MANVKLVTLAAIISSIAVFSPLLLTESIFVGGAAFIQKLPINKTEQHRLGSSLAL